MKRQIRIGTSGWSYDHWAGPFYPEKLPAEGRLSFYAGQLDSTEINNSFYHLPSEQTLRSWGEAVPENFLFAAKASRYITHMKKLKDPELGVDNYLERMSLLGEHLGPILFQLPPRWRFNPDRLEQFLGALSKDFRYAFELRDPSWLNGQALDLLAQHRAAFCIYELDGFLTSKEVTTDFVYVRLHGPDGAYQGDYDPQTLAGWAEQIAAWRAKDLDVYCFFDNDEAGCAVKNALTLCDTLAGRS